MITYDYFWWRTLLAFVVLICVYIYSFKVYGIKTTLITSLLTIAFFMIIYLSGSYSSTPLGSDLSFFYGTVYGPLSDMSQIFPSFMLTFELGRITLNKTYPKPLTKKDILFISLLVCVYGFCYQLIIDTAAAGLGMYYYLDPPMINIFGYPVYFLFSFSIYGVWGAIFLFIEKKWKKDKMYP